MSKRFHIVINGKSYDAEVEEVGAYPSEMVAVATPTSAPASAPTNEAPVSAASSSGSSTATAPLAGVVLGLAVKVGDTVKEGECFVKIEAMKMENEIPSPKSGTVTKVYVSDGQQVKADDPLIDIA